MDRYEALQVFVHVVDSGSLSAAARAIPMSLTSVSRHVGALESHFGVQLLRRTTRALAMTDEGRVVYDRAKAILDDLDELGSALSHEQGKLSGRLRVSAPGLLGRLVIAPLLPRFLAQHPALAIDLVLVDRAVNLVDEGLHVAVRVGRLPDSSLVARKLDDIQMVLCASPSYLARSGTPLTPEELRQHDCLVFSDAPGPVNWHFQHGKSRVRVSVTGRIWTNSLDSLVSAAIEGAGIVRAPFWQVASDIDVGRLRPVLTRYSPSVTPVHAIFERSKLSSPKIRSFVDFLVEHWGTANH